MNSNVHTIFYTVKIITTEVNYQVDGFDTLNFTTELQQMARATDFRSTNSKETYLR